MIQSQGIEKGNTCRTSLTRILMNTVINSYFIHFFIFFNFLKKKKKSQDIFSQSNTSVSIGVHGYKIKVHQAILFHLHLPHLSLLARLSFYWREKEKK
uniref:Uncharacterized protein n=1 Tax=Anguilla anguilla TaxID=7936 RepID=A0A0E9X5I8_ANGAN